MLIVVALVHFSDLFSCRELSILVDSPEDAEIELYVSYIVYEAKWTPKYDVRVFTNDKQLKVGFFNA
jgi:hypothetical protein